MKTDTSQIVLSIDISNDSKIRDGINSKKVNVLNTNYFTIIHKELLQINANLDRIIELRQTAYWKNEQYSVETVFQSMIRILDTVENIQKDLNPDDTFKINMALTSGELFSMQGLFTGKAITRNLKMLSLCDELNRRILLSQDVESELGQKYRLVKMKRIYDSYDDFMVYSVGEET